LDNPEQIAAQNNCAAGTPDEILIRQSFERRGDAGIAGLLGAFAFAHWDEQSATLTLARDCLGRRGLFYHRGRGFVAFASSLATLLSLPDVPRDLDERLLANFLALNHRERDATFYRGISRVPSRTVVRLTRQDTRPSEYWKPDLDAPPPCESDDDYIARARELFETATARSLRGVKRAAIHLSGGLDSSAVAASIARLGGVECVGYTGLPPPEFDRPPRAGWYLDERPKVEALARLHPSLRTVFVTPRGAHERQRHPERDFVDVPLPHRGTCNLGWFGAIDDRIRADGHNVIFHGGPGNMSTSWTGGLSLAFLLSRGNAVSLLREARAVALATRRSLVRVLGSEAVLPLLPPAAHRTVDRLLGRSPDDVTSISLLRSDVADDLNLVEQWHDEGFDTSYRLHGATSARLRAHKLFDNNQLGRDLGCGRQEAEGIEYRSPFDDRELLAFCLLVPETLFRRNGVPRWFARQVFADRLPREILQERRRGEQAPNWFESLDARKPAIAAAVERLEASSLASRLVDLPRLKRLLTEWPLDARSAEARAFEYRYALDRAVHLGLFIRWVEGGNG
jgi:asparagine synthase (glutamine-hydrolysing)